MPDSRRHTPPKEVQYVEDPLKDEKPRPALLQLDTEQKAWITFPDEETPPDEGPPNVAKIVPRGKVFDDKAEAYRWMIKECTRAREDAIREQQRLQGRLDVLLRESFVASCLKK